MLAVKEMNHKEPRLMFSYNIEDTITYTCLFLVTFNDLKRKLYMF